MTAIPSARDYGRMSWSARRKAEERLTRLAGDASPEAVLALARLHFDRLPQDPPLVIARRRAVIESGAYDRASRVSEHSTDEEDAA